MRIEEGVFEGIRRHVESAYPYEGCGVLAGPEKGGVVTRFFPVENCAKDQGFDVYVMDPEDQFSAFEEIEAEGLERMGFYHSHPDHGAYFSSRDEANALLDGEPLYPGEAYLVFSVVDGEFEEAEAYYWKDGSFAGESVTVVSP